MATTEFFTKDQNYQDDETVYWFYINGVDYGTGREFNNNIYGIVESGFETSLVDCDGYPVVEGTGEYIAVMNTITESILNPLRGV